MTPKIGSLYRQFLAKTTDLLDQESGVFSQSHAEIPGICPIIAEVWIGLIGRSVRGRAYAFWYVG
jgi:hypothetical protein